MAEYIECYTCNPTRCDGCNIHILAKMLHAGKLDRLMDDHHTIIETADVAPVVHGRWELHGNDDDIACSYFCSKCGYNMDEGEYLDNWSHFKYCPNCGARMDGE